jgi:mannose-6-phosphate isomerase-like protein (cupin superfamily)
MRIGDETRPIAPGSILYVPRGTVHAFTNQSGAPAASYAIYFPPFDGKDRVPVE